MEFEHEETSLNTIFADDEKEEGEFAEEEQEGEQGEIEGGLNNEFEAEVQEEDADLEEEIESQNPSEVTSEEEITEKENAHSEEQQVSTEEKDSEFEITAEEKKETPMWQRFMSSEELEELAEQEEESSYSEELEEYEEEPIFDLSTEKQPSADEIAQLRSALQDKQDYFVNKIFGGSERAYDEAIEKIAAKKGWRDASRFIEKEVFKRNMIDMYSEEAVDFTDRLHNYFIENAESK